MAPARFTKPSERLREGRKPADGLSFVAIDDGRMVGTVRLWQRRRPARPAGAAARPARRRSGLPQAAASARR